MPSISTSITSGRLNSGGGYSPRPSISRTFVPEKNTCFSLSCGQVFAEAMFWQSRQKKACSNISGVIPSSPLLELLEDVLGVVGAVVVAHPRVVAPDDEVRAAVVL